MNQIPVIAMVMRSGWVALAILAVLGLLSILTWAIVFSRWSLLNKISGQNKRIRSLFESAGKISDMENIPEKAVNGPLGILGKLGAAEFKRILADARADSGAKDMSFYFQSQFTMASDRISTAITTIEESLNKGLVLLAMSSAVGPFLGLLGTVWGIMDSFFEIGEQGSASLPVVAPGIAEALITTIVGLIVAIPALFFYNLFTNRIEKTVNEMESFSELMLIRIKRDIFALLYRPRTAVEKN